MPPVLESLIISPNDPRQYQLLTLDNQLQVLLVQDDTSVKAAAALTVRVGQFDDPPTREGMAHFLEHMLFLGTKKYPQAGEYQQFISQQGGHHNAWTGPEFTSYYFDVQPQSLAEALDRFCQFFSAPLFDVGLVEKERQSVDSEFKMKLQDDTRRFYQVHKETVNPAHPFAKFSVGNASTLADRPEQPVRDELLAFYQQQYSANLMTLVVVAPQPLAELTELVCPLFEQIPNHNLTKHLPPIPLYREADKGIQISMVPLKETRQLTITFALPAIDAWYRHKPLTHISYLLGHESHGSLASLLKHQGYVVQMAAGGGINGYNFKDYNLTFQLTEAGYHNIDAIVGLSMQFITLVRQQGLQPWRYLERQQLLARAFRYQEQAKAVDIASHLSVNMHHYDAHDTLYGDYRMDGLDVAQIDAILAHFTVDNLRLNIVAPEVDGNRHAQWYQTPYRVDSIPLEQRQRWLEWPLCTDLALPLANPYLSALVEPRPAEEAQSANPTVIYRSEQLTFWHKKNDQFQVPKAHLFLALDSIAAHDSCRAAAMTRLYISLLMDNLAEYTYDAEVAGLYYNIYPHQGGLTLHLHGFSGAQEKLLALLLHQAQQREFRAVRFDEIKQQVLRSWHGSRNARPVSRLFGALSSTVQARHYSPLAMADELATVTLAELNLHLDRLYQRFQVEALAYGDWTREEVDQQAEILAELFALIGQAGEPVRRQLIDLDEQGSVFHEIESHHADSAIVVYYQSRTADPRKMAMFCLLNHAMSSEFFNELRTKQQLGYMVGTSYVPMNRQPGILFYIQSPVTGPLQLLESIDRFIQDFGYALMQISSAQWQQTQAALAAQLLEPDRTLKSAAHRAWSAIGAGDHDFLQREQLAEQLRLIERADLLQFIQERMHASDPNRLILYSAGQSHGALARLQGDRQIIDLAGFKNNTRMIEF